MDIYLVCISPIKNSEIQTFSQVIECFQNLNEVVCVELGRYYLPIMSDVSYLTSNMHAFIEPII